MVVGVQQPSAECTTIFTVCIVTLSNTAHLPLQWQYPKSAQINGEWINKNSARIQDQR